MTGLGPASAVSCMLHAAILGASLVLAWPVHVRATRAAFPVELVEGDVTPPPAPRLAAATPRLTHPDAADARVRPKFLVRRQELAPSAIPSEWRDVEAPEPAPVEPVGQGVQRLESPAAPAAPRASSSLPAASPSPVTSAAGFGEAGDITADPTQPAREAQSSGSAAPTGLVAAIQPSSTAVPQVTHAARPRRGYQVRPTYPAAARRAGAEGTTLLKVYVLDDGRIGEVQVERSAGHVALDEAATAAVRKWHFEPARSGGDAVAVWVLIPVNFRLRGGF